MEDDEKIGIDVIRDVRMSMTSNHTILIINGKLTPIANQTINMMKMEKKWIEIFFFNELMFNPTKHCLVPKHILMTKKEKDAVLSHYSVNENLIPKILTTDRIARHLGLVPGDMLKIIRNEGTIGNISYRITN